MSKPGPSDNSQKTLVEELYANLQRRFSRMPQPPEPIVYEFTHDRALLHQYYRIRETMYRKIHNTDKFTGKEDLHDKIGHILIARRGKLCIGGCRVIIREADEDFLLPMEDEDFKIRDTFPDLPLAKLRHAEISRFAVMDDDENHMEIMLALSQLIIEKCISADVAYVFIKSPGILMARNWRKIISAHCGQKDVVICMDVNVPIDPDYPEINWQLIKLALPASKIMPVKADEVAEELYAMPTESLIH